MSFSLPKPTETESLTFAPHHVKRKESPAASSSNTKNLRLPRISNGYLLENKSLSCPRNLSKDGESKDLGVNFVKAEETAVSRRDETNSISPLTDTQLGIVKHVKDKLKQKLEAKGKEMTWKQKPIRQKFSNIVDNSKLIMIKSCLNAEKLAIDKLEKETLKMKDEVIKNRALRLKKAQEPQPLPDEVDASRGPIERWLKVRQHVEEMATLRRIEADLERARARRKVNTDLTIAITTGKLKASDMLSNELRRLAKVEEVHKLVLELEHLDLSDEAAALMKAVKLEENFEIGIRAKLYNENLKATLFNTRRNSQQIAKLRRLLIENKERLIQMRLLEEKKKREKKMTELKKKARNMELQKAYMQSMLNTRSSRSHKTTFFPKLPAMERRFITTQSIKTNRALKGRRPKKTKNLK